MSDSALLLRHLHAGASASLNGPHGNFMPLLDQQQRCLPCPGTPCRGMMKQCSSGPYVAGDCAKAGLRMPNSALPVHGQPQLGLRSPVDLTLLADNEMKSAPS